MEKVDGDPGKIRVEQNHAEHEMIFLPQRRWKSISTP
jgi:hypothetical protein